MKSARLTTPLLSLLSAVFLPSLALALEPPPGGGYPNNITALGTDALFNGNPGLDNTGIGFQALYSVTSVGTDNTAVGYQALHQNTTGADNVAMGFDALYQNTTGIFNIAIGSNALGGNMTGVYNVAVGWTALQAHAAGGDNVAVGPGAMSLGFSGGYNVAIGSTAMAFSTGDDNVAVGDGALNRCTGNYNVGIGQQAGLYFAGDCNIAMGRFAGQSVTGTGSNNIEIGNQGMPTDANIIRLGDTRTQQKTFIAGINRATISGGAAVMINNKGQLGVATSSARFKEGIEPMKEASEAILSLEPVKFRYKKDLDPEAIPQFGLVAEQVAKVDPDLVARDEDGKPYTVRYEAVNAMLLNEFLKEHRKVEDQDKKIAELEAALKEQAAQIEKVSARVEANLPVPQVVSAGE